MNKIIVSALALLTLFSAGAVSAQTYYPTYSSGCVSLSRDLSVGSRGSDVSSLQSFLVSQNYPGSGSWMVTGYFGAATQAAVRIFQGQHGLAQTGFVDASTRASISNCGTSNTNFNYNYNSNPYAYGTTYPYTNNTYNTYPYNYNYNYSSTYPYTSAVSLSSLSVTSAVTGASVTISGSGFDYNNNTVYVGSVPVTGIPSYNTNSLSFVVPQSVSGSVMVYVSNSRGSSNSLTLNVINSTGGSGCMYPYNYGYGNCGCNSYGFGTSCQNSQLTITSLAPNSGAVGSSVTVYGTGFSTAGNTVHFGGGIIANIGSSDGRAISFTVPAQLVGYNSQVVGLGVYPVSVTNSAGYTSNTMPYTVTALGGTNAPTISGVAGPSTLSTGVAGTWTVTVLAGNSTYTSVAVRWGDESTTGYSATAPQTTYLSGSQTFTFTHSYSQNGNYTVTFTVSNLSGQSSISTASVNVTGAGSGQVSLTSLSPTSGRIGSQIVLQGSGFTTYDNTVHFGIGGTQHLVSQNGTQIYYTIPSYITPCDVATTGTYCALYAQQVTPGTYQVYVTNALGQTNQQTFTVIQ
jgi:peptidoglycan hydrolase-like protein with peptidoglycan-binding domain